MATPAVELRERFDAAIRFFLYVLMFWLPYGSAVVETCVILALILWIMKHLVLYWAHGIKEFPLVSTPLNGAILVFIAVCLVSVVRSETTGQSWSNFLTKTMEWFVVYFLVVEVFRTRKHFFVLAGIFLFTAFSTGIDAVIQFYLTGKDIFSGRVIELGSRATAGFDTAPALGGYLTSVIPFAAAIGGIKNRYRYSGWIVFGFSVWALVLTFTRGAWLGAAVGCLVFLLMSHYVRTRARQTAIIGAISLVILCIFVFKFTLGGPSTSGAMKRTTAQWRLETWQDSLKMIKERPFFGHGINTYMQKFQKYRRKSEGIHEFDPTYAHNCYVQLTAETGFLGLLSFMAVIILFFKTAFEGTVKATPQDGPMNGLNLGLVSGISGFLTHSFFDNNFYTLQLSVYLWYLAGLVMALYPLLINPRISHAANSEENI